MRFPSLSGIVTVLNTPFRADGAVDYAALERHAELALEAGVAGFLVPAFAGEVLALTEDERIGLAKTVRDVARGRAVVVGGASAPSLEQRLRNAEALGALGVDIVLASQPFADDDQYVSEIAQLAGATDLPVMVQDFDPAGSGVPMRAILAAFHDVPQFRYLKLETVDACHKGSEIKAATDGKINVSGGWAVMQLIEALDRDVDAFMPTGLHRLYVEIFRRHRSGDRPGAVILFRQMLPILAFSNQHLEHSIHFFKRLLWREGIYPTDLLRNPAFAFDAHHQRIADELIDLAIWLQNGLPVAPDTQEVP